MIITAIFSWVLVITSDSLLVKNIGYPTIGIQAFYSKVPDLNAFPITFFH